MDNNVLSITDKILKEISKVVVGKEEIKELLLVTLLSGGHLLIEGLPGTAKTTLARVFAQVIGGEFKRIQFTPDMLPTDITGFYIYSSEGSSRFVPGPIQSNIVLADELNRATPRTQAALLEAMQENQVTVEGVTHVLPSPFMVIASQIPYGGAGTYPLTVVQADRFLLRAWSGYPSEEEEKEIVGNIDRIEGQKVEQVVQSREILESRVAVRNIYLSEKVRDYILSLVKRVRQNPDVLDSPGPRAGIALYKASKAMALLRQRDFVIPDDVKMLFAPAVEHRVRLRPGVEVEEITQGDIIKEALAEVPVPKEP